MGYVNESSFSPPVDYTTSMTGINLSYYSERNSTSATPQTKSQYGFRSGAITGHELDGLKRLNQHGTWGQQATMLDALDRIQRSTSSSGYTNGTRKQTHYRTYDVTTRPLAPTSGVFTSTTGAFFYQCEGVAQITGITPSFKPADLSTSTIEGISGKIMRRYRPTKPTFDLTRFTGELRDAPSLFSKVNYIPDRISDFGGSYLNYQFGITPTASDLQKAAEAIIKSHDLVNEFVRQSAQTVHKSHTEIIDSNSTSGTTSTHVSTQTSNVGPFIVKHDLGGNYTSAGLVKVSYAAYSRRIHHVFSTFEFFVGDPYGYTTRMEDYLSKAKKLVGGGLTLPVAYQLTPFTWMLDWFYDIGGLLAYQQDVADNGIVQTYGGSTITDEYYGSVSFSDGKMPSNSAAYTGGGTCNFYQRHSSRRPGSPYDMSPTWSMDPYKWAIVGALGLTKAKGLQPS